MTTSEFAKAVSVSRFEFNYANLLRMTIRWYEYSTPTREQVKFIELLNSVRKDK